MICTSPLSAVSLCLSFGGLDKPLWTVLYVDDVDELARSRYHTPLFLGWSGCVCVLCRVWVVVWGFLVRIYSVQTCLSPWGISFGGC